MESHSSTSPVPSNESVPPPVHPAPAPSLIQDGPITSGTFKDKTDQYNLGDISTTHIYAVDWNNDNWTDLVLLPDAYSAPVFYLFDPKLKKFIKSDKSGFSTPVSASFLNFADFDKDGILDVIVSVLNQKTELTKHPLRIFKGNTDNNSIHFTEIPNAFPDIPWPVSSLALLDYDLDGELDLYVGNWWDFTKSAQKLIPDRLFKGKGMSFSDVTHLLEGEQAYNEAIDYYVSARPTAGVSTCDFNHDGYPDILTASSNGFSNKLWMNMAEDGTKKRYFVDYAPESEFDRDRSGRGMMDGGNNYFAICNDYNHDSLMDIFNGSLSHAYDLESVDRPALLTNSRKFPPSFVRTEYVSSAAVPNWVENQQRGIWWDYNLDGHDDLLVEDSGAPPFSRLTILAQDSSNQGQFQFKGEGLDIMNPTGSVLIDFNRDGRMDVIVGQTSVRDSRISPDLYVFENQTSVKGRKILRFKLQGIHANRSGLGSMFLIETSRFKTVKWVEYNQGWLGSQNEAIQILPLRSDEKLKKLQVRWPILDKKKKNAPLLVEYNVPITGESVQTWILCENGRAIKGNGKCSISRTK